MPILFPSRFFLAGRDRLIGPHFDTSAERINFTWGIPTRDAQLGEME